jgi:hypothetical protein
VLEEISTTIVSHPKLKVTTSRKESLPQIVTFFQQVEEFQVFYGSRRLITRFKVTH